jgi:hypothetical protein
MHFHKKRQYLRGFLPGWFSLSLLFNRSSHQPLQNKEMILEIKSSPSHPTALGWTAAIIHSFAQDSSAGLVSMVLMAGGILSVGAASLLSLWTFDTNTVVNSAELTNAVVGRTNGVVRQASSFGPVTSTLSTADEKVGGAALALDGAKFLQLSKDAVLNNLLACTFATWVKVDEFGDPAGLASIFTHDGNTPPIGKLLFNVYAGGHLEINTYGDGLFEVTPQSGWFHWAFTHDVTTGVAEATIYLNGIAVAKGPKKSSIPRDISIT